MKDSIVSRPGMVTRLITRRHLFGALRVLVSVGLMSYLLATANLGELFTTLKSSKAIYFVLAVLLGILRNVLFAYRWKMILSTGGIEASLLSLFRSYFVGTFFNLFLPTALGGDVARGADLALQSNKKLDVMTSVLMERVIGFFALVVISLIALMLGNRVIQDRAVSTAILATCLAYFVFTMVLFNDTIMRKLVGLLGVIKLWDVGGRLKRMYELTHVLTRRRAMLSQCFFLSVICQTLAILAACCLSLTINLTVAPIYFFMVLPMIWIITMIPVSINGLGLREGAFVFFFTKVGVSESAALLLSFLNFSQMIVLGLIGGSIYLLGRRPPVLVVEESRTQKS